MLGLMVWLIVFLRVLVAAGMTKSSGSVVGDVAYVVIGPNEMDLVPFLLTPSLRKEDFIRGASSAAADEPIGIDLVNRAAKSKVGGMLSCGTGANGGSLLAVDEKWWPLVSATSPCCCCCWKLIIIKPGGWGVIGLRHSGSANEFDDCCWRSWFSKDWQSFSSRRKSRSASDADFSASLALCCNCWAS